VLRPHPEVLRCLISIGLLLFLNRKTEKKGHSTLRHLSARRADSTRRSMMVSSILCRNTGLGVFVFQTPLFLFSGTTEVFLLPQATLPLIGQLSSLGLSSASIARPGAVWLR
jgi:hypothetical protein